MGATASRGRWRFWPAAMVLAMIAFLEPRAALAQETAPDKLPRFASLRSDEVNLRVGQGDKGWVLGRMVSDRRAVVVAGAVRDLHHDPDPASPVVARAEAGVIAKLLQLKGGWCRIEAGGDRGSWAPSTARSAP